MKKDWIFDKKIAKVLPAESKRKRAPLPVVGPKLLGGTPHHFSKTFTKGADFGLPNLLVFAAPGDAP